MNYCKFGNFGKNFIFANCVKTFLPYLKFAINYMYVMIYLHQKMTD